MNRIVRLLFTLILFSTFISCKKLVEETQKNAFLSAMTDGQWRVDTYMEGTISITDQFNGYQFQFKDDGTVIGTQNSQDIEGTWIGDISNYAINSNFPEIDPLKKLNGTWKITSAQTDFVNAEMTTQEGKKILRLKKA
jgi:hypothetical protein